MMLRSLIRVFIARVQSGWILYQRLIVLYHSMGELSRRQTKLVIYFSYFSQKIDFDISYKLSPKSDNLWASENLFSRKKNK